MRPSATVLVATAAVSTMTTLAAMSCSSDPVLGVPAEDGGADVKVPALDASADADAGPGNVDSGLRGTVREPEGVTLLPTGFVGATSPMLLVCGAGGCRIHEAATGRKRADVPPSSDGVSGIGVSWLAGGSGPRHDEIRAHGNNIIFTTPYVVQEADFSSTASTPCGTCNVTDLTLLPEVATNSAPFVEVDRGRARVDYRRYGGDAGVVSSGTTSQQSFERLDAGDHGPPISAFALDITKNALVLTAENGVVPARLFLHNRDENSAVTPADNVTLGTDPRLLRCLGGVCVVTNFGSGTLTTFVWDGNTAPTNPKSVTVGQKPLGVDLRETSGGVQAVVVNSGDGSLTFVTLSRGGEASNKSTKELPNCPDPRRVAHVPDLNSVAVTCKTEAGYALVPVP